MIVIPKEFPTQEAKSAAIWKARQEGDKGDPLVTGPCGVNGDDLAAMLEDVPVARPVAPTYTAAELEKASADNDTEFLEMTVFGQSLAKSTPTTAFQRALHAAEKDGEYESDCRVMGKEWADRRHAQKNRATDNPFAKVVELATQKLAETLGQKLTKRFEGMGDAREAKAREMQVLSEWVAGRLAKGDSVDELVAYARQNDPAAAELILEAAAAVSAS